MKKLTKKQKIFLGGAAATFLIAFALMGGFNHLFDFMSTSQGFCIRRPTGF